MNSDQNEANPEIAVPSPWVTLLVMAIGISIAIALAGWSVLCIWFFSILGAADLSRSYSALNWVLLPALDSSLFAGLALAVVGILRAPYASREMSDLHEIK